MKNKNIEKKFLPEGYRYLKEGEPIKQGDYFWGDKNDYMYPSKWYSGINKNNTEDTNNWITGLGAPVEHVIRKKENKSV
jgi:hypothetical protein